MITLGVGTPFSEITAANGEFFTTEGEGASMTWRCIYLRLEKAQPMEDWVVEAHMADGTCIVVLWRHIVTAVIKEE